MSEQQATFPKLVVAAVVVAAAVGGLYFLSQSSNEEQVTPEVVAPAPVEPAVDVQSRTAEVSEPQIESEPEVVALPEPEVVVVAEPEIVLPSLDDSDMEVRQSVLESSWLDDFPLLLVREDLIRKFVVFVDNAAKGDVVREHSPVKGPTERFEVVETDTEIFMAPSSSSRYDVYASLLTSLDANTLITLYNKYKPLVTEAYGELGYPDQDFDLVLMQAIEVVLETPEVPADATLESPRVMYQYANSDFESLPGVQKQLLRMGPENAKKIKVVLKTLQEKLAS